MVKKEDVVRIAGQIMENASNIRNIGIVAHIDHGKTTLTDNLISANGLISEELSGKQCFMDFYSLEQERGITINAANITLISKIEGEDYLINLIDTPGHIDFGGDVIRAMRAVDGVVVVIDVVEGVMPQTETVLKEALREYVKPILFFNKVDRLINELKVDFEDMQNRFIKIITAVNRIIEKNAPPEYKEKWQVKVQDDSVGFGSAYNNWAVNISSMQKTGIGFKDVYAYCQNQDQKTLAKKSPLSDVLIGMVVKHLPNPIEAQKYRIPKIWKGDLNSEEGKAMMNCDPNGPFTMMVTDVVVDPHAGDIVTGRIFSGKINKGDEVILVGYNKKAKVQQIVLFMGPDRIPIEGLSAGNIGSIIGLKEAYAGTTIASKEIQEFEQFMTNVEPVITMSIEAKDPKMLPKLINAVKQVVKEDPNVQATINQETGEHLISGMGELHLEIVRYRLEHDMNIPLEVSPPIVLYNETITKPSQIIWAKTPNKHNKFKLVVEPVPPHVLEKLKEYKMDGKIRENKDEDKIRKLIEAGLDKEEAKRTWAINNNSLFINRTRGIIHIGEVKELLIQAFNEATNEGPLAKEKVSGIIVYVDDAILHEDAIHRGPAQVIPCVVRGIYAGIMSADPILLEPKQKLAITVPNDFLGSMTKELQSRRVQLEEMRTEGDDTVITAKAPVRELIGFSAAARAASQGRAIWTAEYWGYEPLPRELQKKVIEEIRRRKGMEPEPKGAEAYMDE